MQPSMRSVNPTTQKAGAEDQKLKGSLGYKLSSKPAWESSKGPCLKRKAGCCALVKLLSGT